MDGAAEVEAVATSITMWGGVVHRLWVVLLHCVWLGSPHPYPQREDGRHRREGGHASARALKRGGEGKGEATAGGAAIAMGGRGLGRWSVRGKRRVGSWNVAMREKYQE
jgi:hypothetical protein